ncbi:MAG: DNA polymerase III subunit delta [Myxococcales bacterium]
MKPEEALREAERGKLRPVYLVVGEEVYLRDRVVAALRSAALVGGLADFNEDRFSGGEVPIDRVFEALRTVPMMARRRLVVVRAVDRWEQGEEGAEASKGPLDRLAEYVAAPIASTCLVLVAGKLDGRRRLATAAKKASCVVTCDLLGRDELANWIVEQCTQRGSAIERGVAEFVAELAGPELSSLQDAVERLTLYAGVGASITEDVVSVCVVRTRLADVWALVRAVAGRKLGEALRLLSDVYDPRDRGLPLLGAVAWSVRQLARYHAALESGMGPEQALKRAGVFGGQAREFASNAKAVSAREVERWLVVLGETDLALKGSRRPPEAILEDMLMRLCPPLRGGK